MEEKNFINEVMERLGITPLGQQKKFIINTELWKAAQQQEGWGEKIQQIKEDYIAEKISENEARKLIRPLLDAIEKNYFVLLKEKQQKNY